MLKSVTIELTPKEWNLIMFMRNKLKYGKVELVIHAGQPQKVVVKEQLVLLNDSPENLTEIA